MNTHSSHCAIVSNSVASLCVSCHSAIWCWCQIQFPENPVPASVIELLQQVSQHEDKIMDNIRIALENPPLSVHDVSETMDDLEVEQADSGCCGEGCKETDCCRSGENMDLDAHHQPQKLRTGSSSCSCSSGESLNHLLQHCMDVVSELGLPQELIGHIRELNNIKTPENKSLTENKEAKSLGNCTWTIKTFVNTFFF